MSINNYILNLLNIKDENIFIHSDIIEKIDINGKTNKIIKGFLTYIPTCCTICGIVNDNKNNIIKWGFKRNCKVKIPKISNCNSILFLDKQRYLCKECNKTFICETNLVNKHCNISNNTNDFIRLELMSKTSQKDIANRANVSTSSVEDVLCNIASNAILRHSSLPVAMNWDEFKATTDTKSKMAFIIMDNINGTIFDINDSRYSSDLYKYFSRYPRSERNKVKLISTDFYSGYINTAKQLFRNADIVIDRFHIVTQIYKALNGVRINLCKKSNPNYNKLKRYWKLILMNEDKLTDKKKYSKYFRKEISNKDIVTFLVNTDKAFKANYECYQGLLKALDKRDFNKFNQIINHPNKYIDPKMKKAFRLFKSHIKYIENAFNYEINNGIIEGTNNLIKCIKRIAFGYRKFKNFMTRILLIKGILKG